LAALSFASAAVALTPKAIATHNAILIFLNISKLELHFAK
jgi:hypothetical protein